MLKDDILLLQADGLSYNAIAAKLGCSKGTISYYLGSGQQEKARARRRKWKLKQHPFLHKIEEFSSCKNWSTSLPSSANLAKSLMYRVRKFSSMKSKYHTPLFTLDQLLAKIGDSPRCYLTGKEIDIYDTRSYHFDHIKSRGMGGDNSLDNLGIATSAANQAKSNLPLDEFYQLCKMVVNHLGPQFEK